MTSVLLLLLLFLCTYLFSPFPAVSHLNEEPTPTIFYFMVVFASVVWLIAVTVDMFGSKETRKTVNNQEVVEEENEH